MEVLLLGKKKIIGYLVLGVMLFVLAVSLQGCAGAEEDGQEGTNDYLTALDMETDISAIYTLEYQEDIEKQIEALKEENSYTLEDPLVIADPYGTNTTGLYVFFTSDTAAKASYTVSADGYEPFGEELYGDYTTEHEYLLIGMIPDTVNTITLTLQDEEGETAGTLELEYDAPSLAGSEENTQLEVKEGESGKELSDGLYTMLGNRTDEDNEETDFILLYDNYGTLRKEIPIKSYRACNILFGDDEIYFSASANELVAMDRLGRITEIYTLGDYQLHHDYIFGSREDFLVLATEEGKDTEEEESQTVSDPVSVEGIQGNVEFEHVHFGYHPDKTIIKDFSAAVKAGQKIAIVGPTGAGKTTMIKLLMRFYDVNSGAIKVDGHDIRDFDRGELRKMFGMVLQDTWIFHGSIMENIRYGKLEASDEEVIQAAKAAHVHRFVQTLPGGYGMELNEEASNVSQGQKQLLTIARAILADPKILILDEATSSVDTRTEVLIQKAMDHLMEGRTSFIIAHRLSTIRDADLILVMREGDIAEQGTHEELLAKNGFYADLYNSQFEFSDQTCA